MFVLVLSNLALNQQYLVNVDIHVHVPEGAVPKDGQAQVSLYLPLLFLLLTEIKVKNDVAMTGEITLKGRVTNWWFKRKIISCIRCWY